MIETTYRRLSTAMLILILAGCNVPTNIEPTEKPVEGWQDLKFGTPFDNAILSLRAVEWNPVSVSECYDRIAIEGCSLFSNREQAGAPLKNGIMYLPTLTFNRAGQLTEISTEYRKDKGINLSQCRDILRRTVDSTVEEFGSLRWPSASAQDEAGSLVETTDKGHAYKIWYSEKKHFCGWSDAYALGWSKSG